METEKMTAEASPMPGKLLVVGCDCYNVFGEFVGQWEPLLMPVGNVLDVLDDAEQQCSIVVFANGSRMRVQEPSATLKERIRAAKIS